MTPPAVAINQIAHRLATDQQPLMVAGLNGSAPAFLLASMLASQSPPLLIITSDPEAAEELWREISFYRGGDPGLLLFPAWDVTPFEHASPHADIVGQRLSTLHRLQLKDFSAVIAPLAALTQRLLPLELIANAIENVTSGIELPRDHLLRTLVTLGYLPVPLVEDRGTFAIRGGILDLFPPDATAPVRIEFFGDFVESLRSFDPLSQRSLAPVEQVTLLPSREVILTAEVLERLAERLKERCDELGIPPLRRRELLEQLKNQNYPPGIEFLLPLIHPGLVTITDYLGDDFLTVLLDPTALEQAREEWKQELIHGEEQATARDDIIASANSLYLTDEEVHHLLTPKQRLLIPTLAVVEPGVEQIDISTTSNSDLKLDLSTDREGVLRPLVERLQGWLGKHQRVIVACHQRNQAQRLLELLAHHELPLSISPAPFADELKRHDGRVDIILGPISRGFRSEADRLVVIAEEEIFGRRVKRRGVSELKKKQLLTSLLELKPGDTMVHIDHGIGIYRGLQHLNLSSAEGDFLLLEYAGGDRLYLPVDRLNLVSRYVGADGVEPRIDKLGGVAWEKAKGKAREAIEEMAQELLQLYAARQVEKGHAFAPSDELYQEFEASFTYEETPDQQAAIDDVLADMESERPMDRLVCGDVGYGKTEVAMRGAFKAVMEGKQVAVLVPTTVLAQQHQETFNKRFAAYPVHIEAISRFRPPREQKQIIERLKKGEVDIVIGTHRLLQNDIAFKDLGLLIVDEEQRFGVAHKERLKKYRTHVDIMTLTATPIPRTLHMSLMGIRDLSIIDTPPVDRLAIKTQVARLSDELVREAVLRELRRGGQVFFVHNRVQSIGAMADHLQRIVPEAKIAVAHGQMEEKELERVMLSFMHGESNLLLCTTIIESGLDIPLANTLIVNRADTFGLSQLYQLRGRVGRSKQRAYAYFLIPSEGAISPEARERLKVLQELTELGAGFRIATHDLEIRGAGDLLGAKQSGQIAAVGFDLYTELMDEAIRRLKGEELLERVEPEITLRIPAFIPEAYVKEQNQRLIIYKKLTQAEGDQEIDEVADELADRFGPLPEATIYLLNVMKLRLQLKKLLITTIDYDGRRLTLSFHPKTPVVAESIIALIQEDSRRYQLSPDYRLTADVGILPFDGLLEAARNLLKRLLQV